MKSVQTKEYFGVLHENKGKLLLVVFGGSDGGMPKLGENLTQTIQSNFNVLYLPYFGIEPLQDKLEAIPIEYFQKSIRFYQNKLNLQDKDTTLMGTSKGGELVLLLASKYIHVSRVVACVPASYVFQSIITDISGLLFSRSSWTFKGKDIPFVKYRFNIENIREVMRKNYRSLYENSIRLNQNREAEINLDSYAGKLLLISTEDEKDNYWSSKEMCNNIERRGKAQGKDFRHILINIPHEKMYFDDQVCQKIGTFLAEK